MKKMKESQKGFTLIEILMGMVFIIIGVAALLHAVSVGKFFLKQAENKARAMSVALVRMEAELARSYEGLRLLSPSSPIRGRDDNIDWRVNIRGETEGKAGLFQPGTALPQIPIPYQHIEVVAEYDELDIAGRTTRKGVRLENIVPFPSLHIRQAPHIDSGSHPQVVPQGVAGTGPYRPIEGLSVITDFPVPKDVLIIYNISVRINSATGILAEDLIHTACFVTEPDGTGRGPILVITRTPIMSQPLISNVSALTQEERAGYVNYRLPAGQNTIDVRWFKDTAAGDISLREAELMVVAFENLTGVR